MKRIKKGNYSDIEIITLINPYIKEFVSKINITEFNGIALMLQRKAKKEDLEVDYLEKVFKGNFSQIINKEKFLEGLNEV